MLSFARSVLMRFVWFFLFVGLCTLPLRAEQTRTIAQWMALAAQLEMSGQPLKALKVYGEIAAQRPDYRPAASAIDRVLAQMGRPQRAEAVLRYVLRHETRNRPAYLAALRQLDRAHPFRFSGSFGLLPSTNIARSSSQTYLVTDYGTFLIENGGDEKTGIGAEFSVSGDWIFHPAPGHRLRLSSVLSGEWYAQRDLRYLQPSVTLAYENLLTPDDWGVSAYGRYRAYDGLADQKTSDYRAYGVVARKRWWLDAASLPQASLSGSLLAEYRDYLDKQGYDGRFYQAAGSFSHQAGASQLSYGLRLGRSDVRLDYHRYRALGLSAGIVRPLGRKVTAGATLRYDWRRYDADFPLLGEVRHDETAELSVFASFRQIRIGNSLPKLRCSYTNNRSNVALYRYDSFDCGLDLDLTF
ncbi:porin family protein [Thioclava sp. GXIMD4216]|uniref:porin family protein n=1 Tax=Thioclava sp. GXIMD4216 TaxID=3131929 RepID=UPI0030D261FD